MCLIILRTLRLVEIQWRFFRVNETISDSF